MRAWLLCGLLLLGGVAHADQLETILHLHRAVIGGEAIDALSSFRATGTVDMAEGRVRFTLIAARPNLFRLETESGGRALVQGYDGKGTPWVFDNGQWPPRYRDMEPANAQRFVSDAEFDDPLVGGAVRDYALDFAGEVEVEKRKFLRVLATHRLVETFTLLVDPVTYLIDFRLESVPSPLGRPQQYVTRYEQYLPVMGVLLPHAITTLIDGKVTQKMSIERIEPNPPLPPNTFSRPAGVPAGEGSAAP